jgi:murein tripeptide amidase MpaA
MQEWVDKQRVGSLDARHLFSGHYFNYEAYQRFEVIEQEVKELAERNADISQLNVIGKSVDGRDLTVIVIGKDADKRNIFVECGIHAREWISHAACMWILRDILENKTLLDKFNFHLLPVMNPDGYSMTWANIRRWRKSMTGKYHWNWRCKGVDLNRNFDSAFDTVGVSKDPCNHLYNGPAAFSEPETKAVGDYVTQLKENAGLSAYISLHSYRQIWLHPLGYTDDEPKDMDEMTRLSKLATEEIKRVTGADYGYGRISEQMYKTSGCSIDWSYDKLGIVPSFTVEMRDKGEQGFLLAPEFIKPTSTEVWAALQVVFNNIKD